MHLLTRGHLGILIGTLVLAVACSQSASPAAVSTAVTNDNTLSAAAPNSSPASPAVHPGTIEPVSGTNNIPQTVAPAITQADDAFQVQIGYSVGERVPDFQLTLVDGSTFSAQDLISEGRPVFLFFTASW